MNDLLKNRASYPVYSQAIDAYRECDTQKLESLKTHQELTNTEKKLIQARISFRHRKWEEAKIILSSILRPFDHPFLIAENELLLATANFSLGSYEKSLLHNLNATKYYKVAKDGQGLFFSFYNLSVDYERLGLFTLSEHYLKKSKNYSSTKDQQVNVYRAMAWLDCQKRNYSEAIRLIEKALSYLKELKPIDQNILLSVSADIYARAGKLKEAHRLLKSVSKLGLNRELPRTLLELSLIEYLLTSKKIGEPAQSITISLTHLTKWEFVRSLMSGDQEAAKKRWENLRKISPQIYNIEIGEFSNSSEALSIFGRVIHLIKNQKSAVVLNSTLPNTKVGKLYTLLKTSPFPLRKEVLIEKLWDTSYCPQFDARFYKLLERTKVQLNVNITNQSCAYSLK